jgi:ATP-dependent helicase YprA (DUF1998 family)
MNPLLSARNLRTEYLKLLKTAFNPRQPELAAAFHREIEKDGFLTREPFIALAQPHQYGQPLSELLPQTRERFGPICERPYRHQADACRWIMAGQGTVVATGTGSGKTEAFLMPIIDHCLRVHQDRKNSLKALLVYPMNALANDQCGRIRQLLEGTSISFGRYTRETRMIGVRPADAAPNERVLRAEFRAAPPDLLLTNYMMLEYMLLRGDGRDMFRNHEIRFIVLDEVHSYHGLLGTDVACLLRRLREALRRANPASAPLFVGTSATLQAGEEGDPKAGVAGFFSRLTGQETSPDAVVTETPDTPALPASVTLPAAPTITEDELTAFDVDDLKMTAALVRKLAGARPESATPIRDIWERTALPYLLMDWLRQPRSEAEIVRRLGALPERAGVAPDALRREIGAALLVGPCLPDDSPVKLRPRVHRFLRGLARFWRCTNPLCGKLLGEGIDECDACGCRTLPLALCRTCGWDYFVAQTSGEALAPWTSRGSTPNTVFLFDPPQEHVEVEEEEDYSGDDEEDSADDKPADEQEGDEAGAVKEQRGDPHAWLNPKTLQLEAGPGGSAAAGHPSLRPVCLHQGRGTRCPVCRSRYGRFDVLTPVSLGNSSALAHVARALMRDLPPSQRKLLVFCDSRQDAAHQARFITGIEDHLRLRRFVCQALKEEADPHDFAWLVGQLHEQYIKEGIYRPSKKKDEQRRQRMPIEGALLTEFAIAPRVRAGLERLGLVKVRYAGLEDDLARDEFQRLCANYQLVPEEAAYAATALLHEMRQRMALSHEALKTRLYAGSKLARDYGVQVNRHIGIPIAFLPPGQKSSAGKTHKLIAVWNPKGAPTSIQALWRQLLGPGARSEVLEAVLSWLKDKEYLVWETIGGEQEEGEGWQVNVDTLEFEAGRQFLRCSVCDKMASNMPPGRPCCRNGCAGRMRSWKGAVEEGNLNALMAVEDYAPTLYAAEHSAAVSDEKREEAERGFMSKAPPRPNLLACTPTLEMGVNIGDLEAVAMRNTPPSPANYAQRSGRSGRASRMGIVAGFSRNTPHDGYFFDHPDEIIAGAIPPPKFNLQNVEAVGRHVRSMILEHAEIDFPSNLERYLSEKGLLDEAKVQELTGRAARAAAPALTTAKVLWADVPGVTDELLKAVADSFPLEIRAALEQLGKLLARAADEIHKLGDKVELTFKEKQAQDGYRDLAVRLRKDNKYAYLPRVLAEAGLLPGYSFPADPGSVSLGYDPEPVFAGRLQAQREYAPGQIIYARGGRWRVTGIALHRPGSRSSGQLTFEFTLCGSCGLANHPRADFCSRCRSGIGDDRGAGLATFVGWDAGAFQAWEEEVAADAEEERQVLVYDIRPHPQLDRDAQRFRVGPWALDLRLQEDIWFINHGLKEPGRLAEEKGQSPGFRLCAVCGQHFSRADIEREAKGASAAQAVVPDARAAFTGHDKRCAGQLRDFSIGHQMRADTLRLSLPNMQQLGEDGVAWAWSLLNAMIQGAVRLFEIDEEDLDAHVLTKTVQEGDGHAHEEVLDLMWIDRVRGGSGILQRLARSFPRVAEYALKHLDSHSCPNSCYRCLRTYRNQRWHKLLDWRFVIPFLNALKGETVVEAGVVRGAAPAPSTEGPEWDAARAEGCESPQELRLLQAIRSDGGLPEPTKQYEVLDGGRLLTRADLAFLDCNPKLLVYVDGLQWHSSVRQRTHDNRVTNRLQMLNYRVLRFLGTEVQNHTANCLSQIRQAKRS